MSKESDKPTKPSDKGGDDKDESDDQIGEQKDQSPGNADKNPITNEELFIFGLNSEQEQPRNPQSKQS